MRSHQVAFNEAVEVAKGAQMASHLKQLSLSRLLEEESSKAALSHMQHRLHVAEYTNPSRLGTSVLNLMESIKTLEGCTFEDIPELIILNLNSLDSNIVATEKLWK